MLKPNQWMRLYNIIASVGHAAAKYVSFSTATLAVSMASRGSVSVRRACSDRGESLESRWNRVSDDVRLTIIAVSYRQPLELESMLMSLACQTLQNFKVLVMHDGPHAETRALMDRFTSRFPGRFDYLETETRFNDFGHTLRDKGIALAESDYVLVTNGDNYYAPRTMEFAFRALDEADFDIVMWDMVHSHADPGGLHHESYEAFETFPMPKRMDIGCFMAKTNRAKRVGFRDKSFSGDASYLRDLIGADKKTLVGKISKVLMVHN